MDQLMENNPNQATQNTIFIEKLCERVKKYENKKKRLKYISVTTCAVLFALIPVYSLNIILRDNHSSADLYKKAISQSLMHLQIDEDKNSDSDLLGRDHEASTPCSSIYTCS